MAKSNNPEVVLCFMFFALLLGSWTTYVLSRFAPGLKYTVVLFLEGIILALCVDFFGFLVLGQSIDEWISIDPQLLLFTFLPALLFGESMGLNIHDVKLTLTSSLLLAGPGSVFGTLVLGALSKAILPYGWSAGLCNVLGAILCATDPVAVVALLKEVGAPPCITMLVTQEALLNDGAALVLYNLFFTSLLVEGSQQYETGGAVALYFLRVIVVSPLLGLVLGMGTCVGFGLTNQHTSHSDVVVQVALSLVCAYFSFFIAEYFVGVSGVISCMCSGIVISAWAPTLILEAEMMHHVWGTFEWIGNTLIFLLAGLLFGHAVMQNVTGIDCLMVLWVYLMLLAIRGVMVVASFPVLQRGVYGLNWNQCLFLTWGGLRGAVGMALGLSLVRSAAQGEVNVSVADAHRLFFVVGGVVTLTLVINAMTASGVLSSLKLVEETSPAIVVMQHYARKRVYQALVELFLHLDEELSAFDPAVVAAITTAGLKQLGFEDAGGSMDTSRWAGSSDHGLSRKLFPPTGEHASSVLEMASLAFGGGGSVDGSEDGGAASQKRRAELLGLYDSSLQQHGYCPLRSSGPGGEASDDDDLRAVIGESVSGAASAVVGVARDAVTAVGGLATLNPFVRFTAGEVDQSHPLGSPHASTHESAHGDTSSARIGAMLLSPERLSALMDGFRLQAPDGGIAGSSCMEPEAPLPQRTTVDPALLVQVRVTFLEVLRGVYWEHIHSGRLPRTSSAALMLLSSVDYGRDTVTTTVDSTVETPMHTEVLGASMPAAKVCEPMGDWLHLKPQVALPNRWLRWFCASVDRGTASLFKWAANNGVACSILWPTDLTGALHEWHAGTCIYTLASHIQAHKKARSLISSYLGETEMADTPEEQRVIEESLAASSEASAMLSAIDRRVVSYHAARQVTKILSKTKEHVITKFLGLGVIREKDAELLLEEARRQKQYNRNAWFRSLFRRDARAAPESIARTATSSHVSVAVSDPDDVDNPLHAKVLPHEH